MSTRRANRDFLIKGCILTSEAFREPCCRLLECSAATKPKQGGWQCGTMSCASVGRGVPGFDMKVRTCAGASIWISVSILTFRAGQSNDFFVVHLARESGRARDAEALVRQVKELMEHYEAAACVPDEATDNPALTEQEQKVLAALSYGRTSTEVCRDLSVTCGTLRNHLHHINKKLGTHNRLEAIVRAKQRNLI